MSAISLLEELDQMRRELQDDYPGWQIWYVFHRDGSATWHARPNPWLSAPSPDDLRKLISQANPQTGGDAAVSAGDTPSRNAEMWSAEDIVVTSAVPSAIPDVSTDTPREGDSR